MVFSICNNQNKIFNIMFNSIKTDMLFVGIKFPCKSTCFFNTTYTATGSNHQPYNGVLLESRRLKTVYVNIIIQYYASIW